MSLLSLRVSQMPLIGYSGEVATRSGNLRPSHNSRERCCQHFLTSRDYVSIYRTYIPTHTPTHSQQSRNRALPGAASLVQIFAGLVWCPDVNYQTFFVIYVLQNIKFQLPAFPTVWVTIIPTCVTTQFTHCVCAAQLQKPLCFCAHRDGSHEEKVHVTTVCGAAVTASDIHLKLFSVKERVEGRRKQLSQCEKCIWKEGLKE